MDGKLCIVIFLLAATIGLASAGVSDLLGTATKIAGALGTKKSGTIDRGRGCVVNWSYEGMIMGFEWKYMGVCVDSCTGESMTSFKQSKGGAVEHCLRDLFNKLAQKQEL